MLSGAIIRAHFLNTFKSISSLIMHVSLWIMMLHLASIWILQNKTSNNRSHLSICPFPHMFCLENIYFKFIQQNINVEHCSNILIWVMWNNERTHYSGDISLSLDLNGTWAAHKDRKNHFVSDLHTLWAILMKVRVYFYPVLNIDCK